MTRNEAVAVIKFRAAINEAVAELSGNLEGDNLRWADAYYLTHIRSAANGQGYGSAPIAEAERALENSREGFSKLHLAAHALETMAHMRRLERELLPHAEFIREVDEAMKSWMKAQRATEFEAARESLRKLARENGGE